MFDIILKDLRSKHQFDSDRDLLHHILAHVHQILQTQNLIIEKLNKMPTQDELAQQLSDLGTQLDKVLGEIQAEVKKLEDAIATAGSTTPAVDTALASLKAKIQTLDDLNTDPVTGGGDTGGTV